MTKFNINYVKKSSVTFKCTECEMSFWRKDGLKRHSDTVHNKKNLLKCLIFGKKFPRKDTLTRHLRNIHGDK